ncbi:hypothetical protein [Streptomyces boluensis]|uniref:Uncharacterized protein n=1 Tax=Streptomyces boluensis TaxID=1775135 RepID=A0A964UU43_9ACTN|nr:hypothetical protein [Streptomyces boluensis]NBE52967.1 hypothetical protein [Streptomyces boluensis]
MTSMYDADDIAEQQADLTRLLLHYLHQPLPGESHIKGVLPAPPPTEAIRIVTGPSGTHDPDELTAWQIPLYEPGDPDSALGADHLLGILRALHTGTQIYSSDIIDTVMGMPLVHVDPTQLHPIAPSADDNAFTILRTLTCPWTEEQPALRLRGFLGRGPDRLRLYVDADQDTDVVAADVRPSGALTALLAALPSLITEEERTTPADADPHCSRLVDVTDW